MLGEYPIYFAGEEKGVAVVTRQGMFWHVQCRCHWVSETPCSVVVSWKEKEDMDLGICVREGDHWCLSKRLNRKGIPDAEPVFRMMIRHRYSPERLVPLQPDEPFGYISRLKNAYLVRLPEGKAITFRDQMEMSSPTGQWSEPNTCE